MSAHTSTVAPDIRHTVPELMMAWGRGWTISRGTPGPVGIPGGFRVDVGLPGQRVRYVLHTYDAGMLERLGRDLTAPGTWIKASGDPVEFRAALPPTWAMDTAGYLMTAPLGTSTIEPPPYTIRLTTDGGVTVATVHDASGDMAASGQLGSAGEFAIFDQIVTEPVHRRRGLGSIVMRALSDHAVRHGARTGILVATDDGLALYSTLGWTMRSDVPGAFLRED